MWKRTSLFLLSFLGFSAGCGDDEPAGGGGSGGSGASSADGGGGSSAGCAPDAVLAPLNDFLSAFDASSSALAGHAGSFEATGFFLAPGLPGPTSIIAEFFSIFMGCTEAVLFDPACVMGRCTQLECTGRGGGWINHYTLEAPLEIDGFAFEQIDIDHRWADGTEGPAFDYVLVATSGGRTWDATGSGAIDGDSGSLELTFSELFGEQAVLTYSASRSSHEGAIVAGGVTIATVNDEGILEATGDCP